MDIKTERQIAKPTSPLVVVSVRALEKSMLNSKRGIIY